MSRRIGGLIPAAGLSSRMGDFRPLMPLRGKTLIENTIDSLLLCGAAPNVVVLGRRGRDLEAILKSRYIGDGVITVFNPDYAATDMLTSVKLWLDALPECRAFFLLPDGYYYVDRTDVPGENNVNIVMDDTPVYARETVEYIGEPIGMACGPDEAVCQDILSRIQVEYEALETMLDLRKADEAFPSILGCQVAVAAKKCGKPVRCIFDRREDLEFTSKRHPSLCTYKAAVKDGKVTAMDIDVKFNGGAYTTLPAMVDEVDRACGLRRRHKEYAQPQTGRYRRGDA